MTTTNNLSAKITELDPEQHVLELGARAVKAAAALAAADTRDKNEALHAIASNLRITSECNGGCCSHLFKVG